MSDTVYRATCPACGENSPLCGAGELVERWWLAHVGARHPERLTEVRRAVLAGAYGPTPNGGHVERDEGRDRVTATCGACGDWRSAPVDGEEDHHSVTEWLADHWEREHRPRARGSPPVTASGPRGSRPPATPSAP